jgi:hypothetical protein
MGSFIAAGGGNGENSRPLDEVFVRLLPSERPLLYLPIAMNPHERPYENCLDWMRSVFSFLGRHNIVMWTDPADKADADLHSYAGVYIGAEIPSRSCIFSKAPASWPCCAASSSAAVSCMEVVPGQLSWAATS